MPLQRYVALLRGVSPMNAKMPDLRRSFETAGFADVATLLSSGNVIFGAKPADEAALARKAEAAMQDGLGRSFATIVRRLDDLQAMIDADPFAGFRLATGPTPPPNSKQPRSAACSNTCATAATCRTST